MEQNTDWNFLFVFVIGIIGVLVSIVLYFENKVAELSSKLLAAFLFSISIVSLNYGLSITNFFYEFPHCWRVLGWVTFCAPAFSFLYVRSVLFPFKKFDKLCLLLFLPALIYFVILIPIYILPTSEKLIIVKKVLSDKILLSLEPDVILPLGWGTLARLYYAFFITMAEFILLFKWKNKQYDSNNEQESKIFKWLFLFITFTSAICILIVVEYFFHLSRYMDLSIQIMYSLSGIVLFVSLSLLFNPSLLYGINKNLKDASNLKKDKKPIKLTIEQKTVIKEAIVYHFIQKTPFTKVGYSINDLSTEVNIPVYLLSSYINEEYQANFNEWVNDHRIDYLSNLLKTSPKYLKFTLESLSNEAGFNSRSTFNIAIKKRSGKTPSDFFNIKQNDINAI